MASYHTKTFKKQDEYYTDAQTWKNIEKYIPKDKVLWEGFYCKDSPSGKALQDLGFKVISKDVDFFKHNLGDIVVSNPPFTKKEAVLKRLKELNKPFILILPASVLTGRYFIKIFQEEEIQIIIPRKRIQFLSMVDGKLIKKGKCNFESFYITWKMNLPKGIIFLE